VPPMIIIIIREHLIIITKFETFFKCNAYKKRQHKAP
jgi:hypothetical protein